MFLLRYFRSWMALVRFASSLTTPYQNNQQFLLKIVFFTQIQKTLASLLGYENSIVHVY